MLARFGHLEQIPADAGDWHVNAAQAARLAATLQRDRDLAFLFRDLATLRTDIPVFESVDELEWKGPNENFARLATELDDSQLRIKNSELRIRRKR